MKLFVTTKGSGKNPILFLHGLWGGGNYFRNFDFSDFANTIQYFPDEIGFGKSRKPDIDYTLDAHCQAIYESLPHEKPFTIIGNSFGAILAIQFAKLYPELVKQLILISPVIHRNSTEAKQYLASRFVPRITISSPFISKLICKCFCKTRLLEIVSPFYFSSHKIKFMNGCTHHTWNSYYSTFIYGFLKDVITPKQLSTIAEKIPTYIIYGTRDSYVDQPIFAPMRAKKLTTFKIEGTHNVMFEKFDTVKLHIKKWMDRTQEKA